MHVTLHFFFFFLLNKVRHANFQFVQHATSLHACISRQGKNQDMKFGGGKKL